MLNIHHKLERVKDNREFEAKFFAERLEVMKLMRDMGMTYENIGRKFNITRQRVSQIFKSEESR